MFNKVELELIDLMYSIRHQDLCYKKKIKGIQSAILEYVNNNPVYVKVKILDRYATIKYGLMLQRKLTIVNHINKNEYRNLVLSPSTEAVAGLYENDSYEVSEDSPLFILKEHIFKYEIDSFGDGENGFFIDNIIKKLSNSDHDYLKQYIEQIDIKNYFTVDMFSTLQKCMALVSIATGICHDIVDKNFVISENKIDENVAANEIATNIENTAPIKFNWDKFVEDDMTQAATEASILSLIGLDIYDIKSYCSKIGKSKTYMMNELLHDSVEPKDYKYIKQFCRLAYMLFTKACYIENYDGTLESLDIGKLYSDGTFVKDGLLISIISDFIGNEDVMSDEDIKYLVELYSDTNYVVGLALKHTDKPKPEPINMNVRDHLGVIGISDFA